MASALRQAQGEALGNSRFEICSLTLNPYPYPEPVEGSRGAGIGDQPPSSFDRLRMRVWRQAILYPVSCGFELFTSNPIKRLAPVNHANWRAVFAAFK